VDATNFISIQHVAVAANLDFLRKSHHSQQSPLPSKQTPKMTAYLASLEEQFPAIIKTTTKPANTSTNTTTSHQSTSSRTSEKSTGPTLNTRKSKEEAISNA
jgi:hypothetical protein